VPEWPKGASLVDCDSTSPTQQFVVHQPTSDATWRVKVPSTSVCMYFSSQACCGSGPEGRFNFAECVGNFADSWMQIVAARSGEF
jgi:hypothetical protein